MQEVEQIKQSKQNYLRKEILEKGFSPEHFSEYLSKRKEDGTNIDNWTFNELEVIIRQYKSEPVIFFMHQPEFYQHQVQIQKLSQEDFDIKFQDNKIISRTTKEFQKVCDILQREYQGLFLFKKSFTLNEGQKNLKELSKELDLMIKFLYTYKSYLNHKLLNSFFEDEQSTFQLFLKKYQPSQDKRQYILNNFQRKFVENLYSENKLKDYQIESVNECSENSANCVGYMRKYNQKMYTIWERFSSLCLQAEDRLNDLSKIFQKLSNTMNELANQTTIINQKLNLNFKNQIFQFTQSQNCFSQQSKYFKQMSIIVNNNLKQKTSFISELHKQFSDVFQKEIDVPRRYQHRIYIQVQKAIEKKTRPHKQAQFS